MDRCKTPPFGSSIQDPDHSLRHERHVPSLLSAHGIARDFVRVHLVRWGRTEILSDAQVIIGELFTNAITHSRSEGHVIAIDWNGGLIRLEVWDSSPVRPIKRPIDPEAEHGRGIRIVEALSYAWGSRMAASGKCVWAILPPAERETRP